MKANSIVLRMHAIPILTAITLTISIRCSQNGDRKCYSLLNQTHAWFLKIGAVRIVGMCDHMEHVYLIVLSTLLFL